MSEIFLSGISFASPINFCWPRHSFLCLDFYVAHVCMKIELHLMLLSVASGEDIPLTNERPLYACRGALVRAENRAVYLQHSAASLVRSHTFSGRQTCVPKVT